MTGKTFAASAVLAELEPEFRKIVDRTIANIANATSREDEVFGKLAPLASTIRSVAVHEGRLLEQGIACVAKCNPHVRLLPPKPMPITAAAVELLKRNDRSALKGVKLPSQVHATDSYTPDLLVTNDHTKLGLIIDVKRSLDSYKEHRLRALRGRMLAVAAVMQEWLVNQSGIYTLAANTAIIDGANRSSDHDVGVYMLSEIDGLLDVAGAGECLEALRSMFRERIHRELVTVMIGIFEDLGYAASPECGAMEERSESLRVASPYKGRRSEPPDKDQRAPGRIVPFPVPNFGYARPRPGE